MNLLVTGAWPTTPEQIEDIKSLGHKILWQQQEASPLAYRYEDIEGCICNGLFIYHPIERFTSLRYVQLTSAGFDRVPLDYIKTHNIKIFNARGVYSIPMAEHVIACILTLYRKMPDFCKLQAKREWQKIRSLEELNKKRILILGCGNVGTECAKRFQAFGCEIVGLDLYIPSPYLYYNTIDHIRKLDSYLPKSDIVVITLPQTPQTTKLLDYKRLALLSDGSIICNISRGGIIDEPALIHELSTNRLFACLDVFEEEPLSQDNPLWRLPNVMITPHNSFVGQGNGERLFNVIWENLQNA